MRRHYRFLGLAAAAAFIGAPAVAQAQSDVTIGVARGGGNVIVNGTAEGITDDQLPAFRE